MNDKLKSLRDSAEYAEEKLVASVQTLLHEILEEKGMSRTDLANKMGVSKARVSQMFSDNQNFTFRLVAKAFYALGESLYLDREMKNFEFKSATSDCPPVTEGQNDTPVNFDWFDRQLEAGGQPVIGMTIPKSELAKVLQEAMEAALANTGGEKQQRVGDRDHNHAATRDWSTIGEANNVIPMVRKRAAAGNV